LRSGAQLGTPRLAPYSLTESARFPFHAEPAHAFRHLIGGTFDRISEHPVRHRLYNCVSCLNGNHKKWAWASLCSVGFADLYVRLCSMGIWSDWRIL